MNDIRKKILLVEDYEPTIIMTSFYLEDSGYACDVARTGETALQKSDENVYDLIIMDVQLPDMDGMEITRQIRNREKVKNLSPIPIIASTGRATEDDRVLCLRAGMNDCLTKPFRLEELSQKLEEWT